MPNILTQYDLKYIKRISQMYEVYLMEVAKLEEMKRRGSINLTLEDDIRQKLRILNDLDILLAQRIPWQE